MPTEMHVNNIMRIVSELPFMLGWPDHVDILTSGCP